MPKSILVKSLFCLTLPLSLMATNANDADSLQTAIFNANEATDTTINLTSSVLLNDMMANPYAPMVGTITQLLPLGMNGKFQAQGGSTITINGNGHTLDGGDFGQRGFFVRGGTVAINDLEFANLQKNGGLPGGAGLGIGLFVDKDTTVTLKNCSFDNCAAFAGLGLSGPSGGGLLGDGDVGGGGLFGDGDDFGGGGAAYSSNSLVGGNSFDDSGGGTGGGGTGGPGAGGGGSAAGNAGAGGAGGGGGFTQGEVGGIGGEYGGGGGGTLAGGRAGFGGSGGSVLGNGFIAGNGGFGGGGGGILGGSGSPGSGGFGASDGQNGANGEGAALGGAIFVREGATITFEGSLAFANCTTTAVQGLGLERGNEIFAMSTSTLVFDLDHDLTMPSPIGGNFGEIDADTSPTSTINGGLTKKGAHRLELVGVNTLSGKAHVMEGELRLGEATLFMEVEVDQGATLSGDGMISADPQGNGGNLTNSGRFEPGRSGIGQFDIEGVYTQNDTGTLAVEISPNGTSDTVGVTAGSASLAGNLEVFLNDGNYIKGTTFTIVDGPTTGTFKEPPLIVGPKAGEVDIKVIYDSVVIEILNDSIFTDAQITDGPAKAVVECMRADTIPPGSDLALLVEYLGTLGDNQVNQALNEYSPAIFGSFEWVSLRNSAATIDLISDHMFELCCSKRVQCCASNEVWIAGYGNFFNNKRQYGAIERFHSEAAGVAIGFDRKFCGDSVIGVAGGYVGTDLDYKVTDSYGSVGSIWGGVYASKQGEWLHVDGALIGGNSSFKLGRRFNYTNVSRKARSRPKAEFLTAHVGLRGNLGYSCLEGTPYLSLDYHYFNRRPFEESGGKGANLDVECNIQTFLRAELGVIAAYECAFESCCLLPYLGLAWVGELPLNKSIQQASFEYQVCEMHVISYCRANHLVAPQLGFKWTQTSGFSFMASYKGLFNRKTTANTFDARIEYAF